MPLISDSYRAQQKQLHETGTYGVMGGHYAPIIAEIITRAGIGHVLDYGCGSRVSLAQGLRGKVEHSFKYQPYDPAVEKFSQAPIPAELVCCIDVLEHIEEECIDDVLDHLESLVERIGFFSVDTSPSTKTLSDGRNAHILQRPAEWWLPRIMARFDLQTFQAVESPGGHKMFYVIVNAREHPIEDVEGAKLS